MRFTRAHLAARVMAGLLPLALLTGCSDRGSNGCDGSADDSAGTVSNTAPMVVDPDSLTPSTDGRSLYGRCWSGLCEWDTATGSYRVIDKRAVVAADDGTLLVRGGRCSPLTLVDRADGSTSHRLTGVAGGGAVTFSRGGALLSAYDDGKVVVWSTSGVGQRATARVASASALAFSPDGHRLAITTRSGIAIIDTDSGRRVGTLPGGRGRAAWSTDGRWIAASREDQDGDQTVAIWGTDDLAVADTTTYDGDAVAFAPDSHTLALGGSAYHTVVIWEPRALGGSGAAEPLSGAGSTRREALVYSADGSRLYGASATEGLAAWDGKSGKLIREFAVPDPLAR